MGVKDYMNRFQDSQTFSRINKNQVTDSINTIDLFNQNKDEPEPYEYKAIDSQIGSLMKRDYTVDRSQMRNQNLASLVVSTGKPDSTISPNPRHARLNDNLMFKSTNSPGNVLQGMMLNHNTITGITDSRNFASPLKDTRNIKLEPIEPNSIKSKNKGKAEDLSSSIKQRFEENKSHIRRQSKVNRQETEINKNILDKEEEITKPENAQIFDTKKQAKSPILSKDKINNEKRYNYTQHSYNSTIGFQAITKLRKQMMKLIQTILQTLYEMKPLHK